MTFDALIFEHVSEIMTATCNVAPVIKKLISCRIYKNINEFKLPQKIQTKI